MQKMHRPRPVRRLTRRRNGPKPGPYRGRRAAPCALPCRALHPVAGPETQLHVFIGVLGLFVISRSPVRLRPSAPYLSPTLARQERIASVRSSRDSAKNADSDAASPTRTTWLAGANPSARRSDTGCPACRPANRQARVASPGPRARLVAGFGQVADRVLQGPVHAAERDVPVREQHVLDGVRGWAESAVFEVRRGIQGPPGPASHHRERPDEGFPPPACREVTSAPYCLR